MRETSANIATLSADACNASPIPAHPQTRQETLKFRRSRKNEKKNEMRNDELHFEDFIFDEFDFDEFVYDIVFVVLFVLF